MAAIPTATTQDLVSSFKKTDRIFKIIAYFSRSTGDRVICMIRFQYQTMMMKMLGVRNVFMANQTFVKPPF